MRSSKSGNLYRFEESQFVYANNDDTGHIASYAEAALENEKEGLKYQLEETCERIRYEIDGIRRLISKAHVDELHERVVCLEKLEKEKESTVILLYKVLKVAEATRLAEKVAIEDRQTAEVKELVRKVKHYEQMDSRSQRSGRSKMSQRSFISLGSKRVRHRREEELSSEVESLVRKLRTHQIRSERKSGKSVEGRSVWSGRSSRDSLLEYSGNALQSQQIDSRNEECAAENLRKMFSETKQELKIQKDVCCELIKSNKVASAGDEVQKLDEAYKKLAGTAFRLREQLPSLEADDIKAQVDIEDEEVFAVKKQMIKIRARGDDGSKKPSSSDNINKCKVSVAGIGGEGLNGKKNRLNHEMSTIRLRLENQKSLITDLLMTKDMEMMNREVEKLDQVYNDYIAIAGEVRELASTEEVEEMSRVIAEEDNEVFHIKKLVAKFKTKVADDETKTARLDGGTGKEGLTTERRGEQDKIAPEATKLNELMIKTLNLQSAPKVEIETFRGDPLEFSYFMECFKDVVENLVDNPRQRLVRLLKYTEGEAKQLIKHCIHEETSTCYEEAVRLLTKEYGNPFTLSCAYLEKLKSWPQIKANDAGGLKSLCRFLLQCLSYQKRGGIDLDSPLTIRNVQLALPLHMQDGWAVRVGKIRKNKMVEAKFSDFVEYVEEWSRTLSDPVYARSGAKNVKACATEMKEKKPQDEGKKDEEDKKCPMCSVPHDLDDCPTFGAKTAREKKDFLFKGKMCFCCYSKEHKATKCEGKRTCKTCGGLHPTSLHGVSFKVLAVHQEQGGSAMCVVPVRLRHRTWEDKEIEVYALLDECSEGTFISKSLLEKFDEGIKRKTSVEVETVNLKKEVEAYAVRNLIARGSEEFGAKYKLEEIRLPETYSQDKIPMDKDDIPTAEAISKWSYLEDVAHTLPGLKDIPFGLLIGNNCPKALEPMEVIASMEEGPYAKRTRLGWCVSAPSNEDDHGVVKCSSIKVLNTCVRDTSISNTLQEMWREDFIEKESEKRTWSKEDRRFVEEMKRCITKSDGHYMLPLPLRKEVASRKSQAGDEVYQKRKQLLRRVHNNNTCASADKEEGRDEGKKGTVEENPKANEFESKEGKGDASGMDTKKVRIVSSKELARPSGIETNEIDFVVMPESRRHAFQRSVYTKRKMIREKKFYDAYCRFMQKLLIAGHARKVPKERLKEKAWHLPHHGVYHPTKDKLRVVFDCSAETDGVSLNSVLLQGPDVSNSLLGVLLRLRKGKIAVMADIEGMYHQVKLPEEYSKFLRFFWWEDGNLENDPIEYEMLVHPFGAISSKNCVIFALHQTAFDNREELGEDAMDTLLNDFYVDDMLKSLDEKDEAVDVIERTTKMCAAGGFNLTKFVSTDPDVVKSIPIEKRAEELKTEQISNLSAVDNTLGALGVQWYLPSDSFGFKVSFEADDGTRRGSLAALSGIHDPSGLGAPFLLKGRKILQKMTKSTASWDDKRSLDIAKVWDEWRDDVLVLNDFRIRRCYRSSEFGCMVEVTLHCFSDASFIGYGVACYLRMVDEEGRVEVRLVMGKARVSPLKPTTVPRLELTAATVSVKIAAMLVEELKIPDLNVYYWIDNKIVLGYIFNEKRRYRIYVANRVQLIDQYTVKEQWNYVETKDNPGDLASRGISTKETEKIDVWLNGPLFLREKDESWKSSKPEVEIRQDDNEVMSKVVVNATSIKQGSVLDILEERISSWHRMKRVIVWILRYASKEWRKSRREDMTVTEIQQAEAKIVMMMQARAYEKEIATLKSGKKDKRSLQRLIRLNPFLDEEGILRVGGRLTNAQDDDSFKFPVLIPKKTKSTRALIEWHHRKIEHRGKHTTVCELREAGFWVVNGGREVGTVVFRCVRCKWLRGKFNSQMMANLPWTRTTVAPPFTYCGADVFGPIKIKDGRKILKRYGVLFTCFSLRAVHVELMASLQTDSFIQALRRFVARRGMVREIRTDNGTNFVGTENEVREAFEEMDQEKIGDFLTEQGCDYITWKRNTPYASHMGGVWERQIRTVKSVITSLLKSSPRRLDEESLRTFMTEAEGIVNSRPLTLENLHDPESTPLTPNQILTMKTKVAPPPPGVFQKEGIYARKRWRVVQHLANAFWSRWRKEYLQLLQQRQKWNEVKPNLQVGDVVLMKDDGAPRCNWPMARVIELHEGDDELVRSVTLYSKGSTYKRPIHKTILLVSQDDDAHD